MMRVAAPIQFEPSQYPEQSLHGRVVHAMGRRIVSGDLQPGALLPAELELKASRTVVREAIKVLAAKGLVESRPKTGTRVRPTDSWNLLDPTSSPGSSEGVPQPAFLRKLTDFDAFDLADIRFHREILRACDNDVLEQMSA